MGTVHSFDDRALAKLRARLGAAEEANQDLIAFARGHHGAVAAIHQAVLGVLQAATLDELVRLVAQEWPGILGIDHCAVALVVDGQGLHATSVSVEPIDPALLGRGLRRAAPLTLRDVGRGNPWFGRAAASIRAEALIRIDLPSGERAGMLLLGQGRSPGLDTCGGGELLRFLGHSLGAMVARWRTGTA